MPTLKIIYTIWLALITGLLLGNTLHAQSVYISTLGDTLNGAIQGPGDGGEVALPFTTDSASYNLDNIAVSLSVYTPGTLAVALYNSDGSDFPTGSPISTAFTFSQPSTYGDVQFNTSGISLSPNTTYDFVLIANSGYYFVNTTPASNGFSTPSGGNWTLPSFIAYSPDSGSTWNNAGSRGSLGGFSVSATAVPEPSTWAMLAVAGVVLVSIRRKVNL